MKKMLVIFVLSFITFGCASTSDLKAVSDKVSAVQMKQLELEKRVVDVEAHQQKCESKMAQCTEHCASINSKLDRVFKKAQLK